MDFKKSVGVVAGLLTLLTAGTAQAQSQKGIWFDLGSGVGFFGGGWGENGWQTPDSMRDAPLSS